MDVFEKLQKLLKPLKLFYYGDGGTIHSTNHIHVETHNGKVVGVWFRCSLVPFEQVEVESERAGSMEQNYQHSAPRPIHGIVFADK